MWTASRRQRRSSLWAWLFFGRLRGGQKGGAGAQRRSCGQHCVGAGRKFSLVLNLRAAKTQGGHLTRASQKSGQGHRITAGARNEASGRHLYRHCPLVLFRPSAGMWISTTNRCCFILAVHTQLGFMARLQQRLNGMLTTAVLENTLRASTYDRVGADLDNLRCNRSRY